MGTERGFSLLEAVVALAILGLTVVAGLELTSQLLHTQTAALGQREAVAVADWKLNEIASLTVDSARSYLHGRAGQVQLSPREYAWRASLERQPGSPMLWHATVTVEWDRRSYTLETVLRRRAWVMLDAVSLGESR